MDRAESREEIAPPPMTRWGEFANSDLEASFRSNQTTTEIVFARIGILAIGFGFLAFLPSDWAFLGNSALFWGLLVLRLSVSLSAAAIWITLTPDLLRRRFDSIVFAWSLLIIGCCAYIPWTRPVDYTGHIIPTVLTVFSCFAVCPLPFRMQCMLALLISAAALGLCLRTQFPHSAGILATMLGILGALVLGAMTSLQINCRKRELFAAARNQESLRMGLETALAQIRTLRGMHCVCCQCKKMRDEKGSWHPAEVYVRDRTHAEFSHGLCPECYEVAIKAAT